MFEEAIRQMSALPRPVQLWMRWLNIVFVPAVYFAFEFDAARWALAAYLISFPVGVLVFVVTRNIHMTGVPHILFWTPLLVYLGFSISADPAVGNVSVYGVWLVLLSVTIATSLVFDIRAVIAYLGAMRLSKKLEISQ